MVAGSRRRWWRGGEGEEGCGGGGVSVEVFKIFSLDKIIEDDRVVNLVQQRFVEQNFETPCVVLVELWGMGLVAPFAAPGRPRPVLAWKFGHYFYELLCWQTLALVFMCQSTDAFVKNFAPCLGEDELGS